MIDLNDLSSVDFPQATADAERVIPAAKLAEWVRSNRKPTRIRWAVIDGPFNLQAVNYGHELVLQNCVFRGPLDVIDSRFGKSVDLRGSVFEQNLDFSGSRIDGSLLLTGAEIRRGTAAGESAAGPASFDLLRLQGNLDANRLKSQVRVEMGGARVAGEVDFIRAEITGGLDMEVAVIEGSLNCSFLTLHNSGDDKQLPQDAGKAEQGPATGGDGTAFLGGVKVAGQVNLGGAHIAQDLILYSADIQCGLRCGSERTRRTEVGGHALLGAAKVAFGVTLNGARIRGNLSLEDTNIEGPLHCSGATVQEAGKDDWQLTEVLGTAILDGVKISGDADLTGLQARVGLNLYTAELKGGLYCGPSGGRRAEFGGGGVSLAAGRVSVQADFTGAKIAGDLNLQNAAIDGDLSCDGTEIIPLPPAQGQEVGEGGSALFAAVKVTGQLSCNGMRVAKAFNLQSAEIRGGMFCRPRGYLRATVTEDCCTRIGGDLTLAAAVVAGGIHLGGAAVEGGLNLESAAVEGGLVCGPWQVECPPKEEKPAAGAAPAAGPTYVPTHIHGDAGLATARVSGTVDLRGARLDGDLDLESATLSNGLLCTPLLGHRTVIRGPVLLKAANVSGVVDLRGADLRNDLNLEGAQIKSGLTCRALKDERTTVGGQVLLAAAKVSGMVDLSGARVSGDVNMEGALIDGKLSCYLAEKHRTEIGGSAALGGVKVAGAVSFSGAAVGKDLNLRGATIEGKFLCQHAEVGNAAMLGEIKVSGQIDLSGTTVRRDLSLQGAELDGMLICRRTHTGGNVDLGGCSVRRALLDFGGLEEPGARRRTRPAVRMEGFQFQELTLGEKKEDGTDYLQLLKSSDNFEVSTWYAIERWLRNQGKDEEANNVYLAMRGERRRAGRMFFLARPIDWLFDIPIWLAMRYKLLFLLFVVSLALSTWVFTNPSAVRLKPLEAGGPQVAGTAPGASPAPEAWTLADAFWLSLQMNLPMIHIPAAEKWELTATPVQLGGVNLWLHYDYYGSFVSLFGYIGVPLFVGGVAGTWLRKKAAAD